VELVHKGDQNADEALRRELPAKSFWLGGRRDVKGGESYGVTALKRSNEPNSGIYQGGVNKCFGGVSEGIRTR
jgi:hypothetical protein